MGTPRPGGSRADGLTAVAGLRVGHWTDADARTGCTVVRLPPSGVATSALAFGPAPASREYALLDPDKSVPVAHAIVLSGGSAYGLDAASGVMRVLEREGIGLDTPFARVPIVPAAALYDLGVGRPDVRPDAASGEAADPQKKPIGQAVAVLGCVLRGDAGGVRRNWEGFKGSLLERELLYVPLSKGGDPRRIVNARALHQMIHDLLGWLPRLGMIPVVNAESSASRVSASGVSGATVNAFAV